MTRFHPFLPALGAILLVTLTAGGLRADDEGEGSGVVAVANEAAQLHVVERAVNGYIRPAFARLAEAGADLETEVDAFCEAPDGGSFDTMKAAYTRALETFARVEFLRFGPLLVDHRLERLVFWPDRKSTGRRQAEAIVADHDSSVLSLEDLQQKSVAVQGLSALEVVLFDDSRKLMLAGGPDADFRCDYAQVITRNVAAITGDLAREWAAADGYAGLLVKPGADNPAYRTSQEAAAEIVGALTTGLQIIRDQKLEPVIGDSFKKRKPRRAPLRRSHNTVALMAAGVGGLKDMTEALELASALPEADGWIANSITFELANAKRALDDVPEPLVKTMKDEAVWKKLDYVNLVLGGLRQTIAGDLAAGLAIIMGFNSLDGD